MPEISRFYGIVIMMYFKEHNPPHFHAKYAEWEVLLDIVNGQVLDGVFPRKALALVREWCEIHKNELLLNWNRVIENKTPVQIEPLE